MDNIKDKFKRVSINMNKVRKDRVEPNTPTNISVEQYDKTKNIIRKLKK